MHVPAFALLLLVAGVHGPVTGFGGTAAPGAALSSVGTPVPSAALSSMGTPVPRAALSSTGTFASAAALSFAALAEPAAGEELRVFLITMGPGDHVWEHFGHNALWVHDPARGTDKAYNYGIFDFDQPGFLRNFLQGRMLYSMAGYDAYQTIALYRQINRSVWVQELNLTPAQKRSLQEFLDWNERPENSFYHYDYYRDNCSTRIRDALDRVLGGQILAQTADVLTGSTYRSHTRRLTGHDWPVYFGINLAAGQPVDEQLSVWEELFLPLSMREHFRDLTVLDEAGHEMPLVSSESTWFVADRDPAPATPSRTWPWFLAAGLVLGALLAGLGTVASGSRAAAIAFGVAAAAWLAFNGIFGAILTGLWAFTDHYVAYRNENLFQFHPLSLLLLVLLAVGWRRRRAIDAARWLALGIAGLAFLGLLLKFLPAFDQMNADILVLAIPAHLGLAWGVWILGAARPRALPVERRPTPRRSASRAMP